MSIENSNKGAMSKMLEHFDRVLFSLEKVFLNITVISLIGVMLLVACDALGRYFFNRPIIITIYFVSHYMLPLLMLLPASYVLRRSKHISVDLFSSMIPQRLSQFLIGVGLLLVMPVIWIMAYRVGISSVESFRDDKVAYGLIAWPFWVEQAIYCLCFLMLTARILHVGLSHIVSAMSVRSSVSHCMVSAPQIPVGEVD